MLGSPYDAGHHCIIRAGFEMLTICCHYGAVMSADALLWIVTLLFAATMLILSAMRRVEAAEGGFDDGDGADPYAVA